MAEPTYLDSGIREMQFKNRPAGESVWQLYR